MPRFLPRAPGAQISGVLIFIGFLSSAFAGCGHESPTTPPAPAPVLNMANTAGSPADGSRALWGEWLVIIDPDCTARIVPMRNAETHWNVSGLVTPPKCPGCLAVENVHSLGQGLISATVTLTHPFPGDPSLDAFDVRGVVLGPPVLIFQTGTASQLVQNADGYTSRWSHDPWARINAFLDFATQDPERRFASGETFQREFVIKMPNGEPLVFGYAVDACWIPPSQADPNDPLKSPHCNEAWDIETEASGPVNGHPGAFAVVDVSFQDWQGDGSEADVALEAPALVSGAISSSQVHKGDPSRFRCVVSNENGAPPGVYPALVCIRDSLNEAQNDNLTAFALLEITISSDTPPLVGLSVYPEAAALDDQGSQAEFDAIGRFSDGGLARISSGVQWEISGTDLNGATLAKIDSDGMVTRLSSKWWGGTASVRAQYEAFEASAVAYCVDPFADEVDVEFGWYCEEGGTFTQPVRLLGPPLGGGMYGGGLHVCALGYGGVATLEFVDNIIINGPGADLIVFENAFYYGGCYWQGTYQNAPWNETALVEVSQDGIEWRRFPSDYTPENYTCGIEPYTNTLSFSGIAGVHPVYAAVQEDGSLKDGIDPTDPDVAGGDAFDLAEVGLEWCRFVRLIDTGDSEDAPGTEQYDSNGDMILDLGKVSFGGGWGVAGFDGDSVAAVHSASPLTYGK